MASGKAKRAKEQGNEAYKAGDYPAAIGHYTTATIANGSDPIFFLNRAAAYLKLGKYEDAQRDCTKSLSLDPRNVKALFRRAQSLRGLADFDNARQDLFRALDLEPSNASVKDELAELDKMPKPVRTKQPIISVPKRRRVPIEIIEMESEQKTDPKDCSVKNEALSLSTNSRSESKQPAAKMPSLPRPSDVKQQPQESYRDVRVGGGIFRPSGNHTIIARTQPQPMPQGQGSALTPNSDADMPIKPPTTLFDFTRSWNSLNTDDARWKLICTVPSRSLPAFFQASLEPDMLKSILWTLHHVLGGDRNTRSAVQSYLLALMKVQRFGTVMLFMDEQEKRLLESLRREVELNSEPAST